MIRKFALPIFLVILLIITVPLFQLINSQSVSPIEQTAEYELPYPGILPDHPLYFLKHWRDKTTEFLTRDDLKKADFYILLSDKSINASVELSKKGKNRLAIDSLIRGEKYESKVPNILRRLKQQGATSSPEFVNKIKNSNIKHKKIIQGLIDEMSAVDRQAVADIMRLNQEIGREVANL